MSAQRPQTIGAEHPANRGTRTPESYRRGGDLFQPSFTFLRIKGIPVGAHWSWFLVFALIAWTLAVRFFPLTYPGLGTRAYWVMGAVAAVVFFTSILLHELGHALTALRQGVQMEGITLWLFGGVARFSSAFPSPSSEFKIAIAGPVVSLVLTVSFALAGALWQALPTPVSAIVDYLARINALVLGFNLVPALPLDGGRVLRAWLWHRQHNFAAATESAARAGRVFGYMLVGIGVLGFLTGAGTGGLWIAFIGWFLLQAATAEALHARMRSAFEGLCIRDVMTPDPRTVSPDWTIQRMLDEAVSPAGHSTYPVVEDGELKGLMSLRRAGEVPAEQREETRVAQTMLPATETPTLSPDRPVTEALDVFESHPRAVVVEEGRLLGIVSLTDLSRMFERRRRIDLRPASAKRSGAGVWIVVAAALLLAAGFLYRPPLAVIAPGPIVNVADDITITGTATDPLEGKYLLTAVELSRPNALGALIGLFHPDHDVVPLSSVIPGDVDPSEFVERQQQLFDESRMLAAAAAARTAGMDVSITGTGARVIRLVPGAPAAEKLRAGDVIVAVDGRDIGLANEVAAEVRSRPGATEFRLTVERNSSRREVTVRSAELERTPEGVAAIGVLLDTRNFAIDLPFNVEFDESDIGGPSAGLAYALAIYDLLEAADPAGNRTIGASGTISETGQVGPVGGLEQKAAALQAAGAQLFLVPERDVERAEVAGMEIRGVRTLDEALNILQRSDAA